MKMDRQRCMRCMKNGGAFAVCRLKMMILLVYLHLAIAFMLVKLFVNKCMQSERPETAGITFLTSVTQSIKRVLSSVPFNPQSFSESPYYDMQLYSYDEKVINAADRVRPCQEYPCKFYDRKTGRFKFKLDPKITPLQPRSRTKKSAHYIFHPSEPFVISVQQGSLQHSTSNVVNIHSRLTYN